MPGGLVPISEVIDNISLIYPKFDTNIHVKNRVDKPGNFKDVVFDMSRMVRSFTESPYNVYPSSDSQFLRFNNKEAENKKTILFASDSFGTVCVPFLSLSVEDMLFGFHPWNIIINTMNAVNPDIVVILLYRVNADQLSLIADIFNTPSE
jgi:hypothetical protein